MARVALDGASVVIDVLHDNQHEGGTRPPDGRNVEEDAQGPYVRYYYLRCSVLLVRCQVSVVCLSSRKFCGQKEPTHTRPQRHRRPQRRQVLASGVARTVDGRSPSTVTPSIVAVGNFSGPGSTALKPLGATRCITILSVCTKDDVRVPDN